MARTFHLVETLGEGAFGVVHLARVSDDDGFVQRLAIKMLHPHVSTDTDLARRLRDEARLLALMEHDNIVRVHGLTRVDGRLAILMEPVPGADLASAEGTPVPVRAALEITEAVASALCAAWETVPPGHDEPLRAVHRDIKPSNIMVTPRGVVKVMDFGVAHARFDNREASTQSQQFGTARYMAPERWLEGVAGAPSDVFSLGITLLELLVGDSVSRPRLARSAFEEDLHNALSHIHDPPVRGLVEAMCRFSPEERPTAADIIASCRALESTATGPSLRQWAEDWVPLHRRTHIQAVDAHLTEDDSGETFATPARAAPTQAAPIYAPTEAFVLPAPSRATAAGLLAAAVLLLVLMGAVGWWQTSASRVETIGASDSALTAVDVVPEVAVPSPAPVQTMPDPVVADEQPTTAAVPIPAVAPSPRPRVAPAPAPAPSPAPAAVAPSVTASSTVTFALRPSDLSASTDAGPLRHYAARRLAHGIHVVRVNGSAGDWQCTVRVDDAAATWRIDDGTKACVRLQ